MEEYRRLCDSIPQIKNIFNKEEPLPCPHKLPGIIVSLLPCETVRLLLYSETMLRQHFTSIYPLVPVFDYIDFMDSYVSGSFSWFMIQAILASAVPYTALDVLADCGFKDRLTALEFFFSNAVKLYDFGCEENHLVKLQGSLILSTVLVSYSMDKDFRFWHHNAVRLAIRLGIHKE